jgi:hypothetical protein
MPWIQTCVLPIGHLFLVTAAWLLLRRLADAQELTGALIGEVRDDQAGTLPGVQITVSSPSAIGGPSTFTTSETGKWRFPSLSPGSYVLEVRKAGFATYHEEDIRIGPGATIERTVLLQLAGVAESLVVQGAGSRIEARDPGLGARFGPEILKSIPTRRASMFDLVRAAPGVSPTSPSSGTTTTVSALGSGTNENQFLIDGTNTTCPCNGIARAELGVDFIQEIQIQSVGASAEFGNMQGAVINVITRQGSARFLYDASYYGQTASLTSQPVLIQLDPERPADGRSGYHRARFRDVTANAGGPVVRDRLWFFAGYQHLRDYDSQPGSDPAFPRTYEQDKIFAKLTWRLTPGLQLLQSVHDEFWVNPDTPTLATPFEATRRRSASVPAITFGHLTHTLSANTVWDVRAGRFVYSEDRDPSSGDWTRPSRTDRVTGITTGAPSLVGGLTLIRTTAKATVNHYRPRLWGATHQWKAGMQVERGEHHGANIIPTGVRFVDNRGQPFQAISSDASNTGGLFITAAAFASDTITAGNRLTVNAGVRLDHSRAISQDLPVLDHRGRDTGSTVAGLGTMYSWNVWSPRVGATIKLSADGRTMLRASYGRFSQGVLTGEISPFHPGVTPITTRAFETATGDYTRLVRVVDSRTTLQLDPRIGAPHTDEYAIGLDREIGRRVAMAVAYIRKGGGHFIGWTDVGGQYREESRTLPDGRRVPVFVLVNSTLDQRFLLTNPDGYSLSYNGLVLAAEKRRSRWWQAFGSYTFSKASGLQASSGETAAGAQASTVATPTRTFGRDPNDLTNARGRLPNDRPHMVRAMGTVEVPRTGLVIAANLQHFSGKPWAETALFELRQGDQRVLLEPRGSRRLPSQTLVDLRVSRTMASRGGGRLELLVDVLNAWNDTAAEGLVTDNVLSPNFGQPTVFMDPRRAMLGVRLTWDGRPPTASAAR